MAKYAWPAGSTSKTVLLFIQDSASTTGAGRASVSAGNIVVSEIRVQTNNTVTRTTVSVTNLAALTDAFLSGGIFPVEPVTCPGWYRFDIPDSALSTGAVTAGISILGSLSASNIAQLALEIQLQNTPADVVAKAGVTVSVSTLYPVIVRQWDATSVSSSNLAVTDFTTRVNANVGQWAGTSVTTGNIALWQSVSTANVTSWAGAATSQSDVALLDTTDSRLNVNVAAWQGTSVTTANIALWQSVSTANVTQWAGAATSQSDVAIQDTTDSRFNVNVAAWAGTSVSTNNITLRTEISLSVVNVTAWAGTSVTNANVALWQSVSTANVTSWAGGAASLSDLALANSVAASVSAVVYGQAMTESYAADGVAFTIPQALYQLWSRFSEFSISSQVITAFRLDGVTTAMTFSLDSATAPTKVERVS